MLGNGPPNSGGRRGPAIHCGALLCLEGTKALFFGPAIEHGQSEKRYRTATIYHHTIPDHHGHGDVCIKEHRCTTDDAPDMTISLEVGLPQHMHKWAPDLKLLFVQSLRSRKMIHVEGCIRPSEAGGQFALLPHEHSLCTQQS